ncbi:flavodoxin FldA [Parabacteroides sp. Marseille-P3160]|uniref:flavodoxin FldA n=1 Tax=Parabacteroides sp. Marseille-P3160 TaxID=1917887 RepID=UPI0009B9A817|nr:flavodoxin FldA [Parabacteroides sp. Marseille-P3160]
MKKVGIYYGSSTGTTDDIAQKIASKLGVGKADVHDVSKLKADEAIGYDVLVLGSSTWGDGDLQDDWYDGVETLRGLDLSGKVIALFGCGDSQSYSDTFCDAIGVLYEDLQGTGATFVGAVPTDGYDYSDSKAVVDGKFVGLAIDEVNESDKTDERVDAWVEVVKSAL